MANSGWGYWSSWVEIYGNLGLRRALILPIFGFALYRKSILEMRNTESGCYLGHSRNGPFTSWVVYTQSMYVGLFYRPFSRISACSGVIYLDLGCHVSKSLPRASSSLEMAIIYGHYRVGNTNHKCWAVIWAVILAISRKHKLRAD